ncbi:MAG: CehA/McbA family metallohydrolase [Chloroflexi bacterium]|nr:CehA/McbA family metallohydrolase [Chloroflexota bacterium]
MNTTKVWNFADLHLHTTYSDGGATVIEVLEHAMRNTNLRAVAVTDHDEIEGAFEAQRLAPHFGIDVIVGEEISTAHGHLLGLFLQKRIPPKLSAFETIVRIHEQGGLAIAPHPFDASVPSLGCRLGAVNLCALPFDGIEVFNASIFWPWRAANRTAQNLAMSMGMAQIGGSDAHSLCAVGSGRTAFRGSRASDVFDAIRTRTVWADGVYLSRRKHARQVVDMMRSMGVGAFARWVVHVALPAGA